MSLVENLSLGEPNPITQKLNPESICRICGHSFVCYGVCSSCNSAVDDKYEYVKYKKRFVSQNSWDKGKKLHLVLDLDHTLIQTIATSKLSESEKYLIEEAKSRNDLWRFNTGFPSEFLIKLRPFVHQFLKEASELFSMYVYTKGGYGYAQAVLRLIDPYKTYFGDRVITRRESPGMKTLDLVVANNCGIVIVDDTPSVWPDHKRNLLQIAKYKYFDMDQSKESCATSECTMNKRDESDENGPLVSVLKVLKDVHKGFFSDLESYNAADVRPLLKKTLIDESKEAGSVMDHRQNYNLGFKDSMRKSPTVSQQEQRTMALHNKFESLTVCD